MSTEQPKDESDRRTLIEEGTTFKGSLSSKCPVFVRGEVQGDIAAPAVSVSSTGSVHGTVKVKELRSEGELSGDVHAETMHLSGSLKDKTVLRTQSLEVVLGTGDTPSLLFGECTLEVGNPDARREAGKARAEPLRTPQVAPAQVSLAQGTPATKSKEKDKRGKRPSIEDAVTVVSGTSADFTDPALGADLAPAHGVDPFSNITSESDRETQVSTSDQDGSRKSSNASQMPPPL